MIVFGDTYAFRNAVDQDGPNSTLTLGDIMRLGEQQWIVGVLLGACMWTAVCAFTALLRNYILIFGFLYLLLMFYSLIHLFLVVTVSESAYNLIDPTQRFSVDQTRAFVGFFVLFGILAILMVCMVFVSWCRAWRAGETHAQFIFHDLKINHGQHEIDRINEARRNGGLDLYVTMYHAQEWHESDRRKQIGIRYTGGHDPHRNSYYAQRSSAQEPSHVSSVRSRHIHSRQPGLDESKRRDGTSQELQQIIKHEVRRVFVQEREKSEAREHEDEDRQTVHSDSMHTVSLKSAVPPRLIHRPLSRRFFSKPCII